MEAFAVCAYTFVAKFIYLWHLHLFIAARYLLACVFRELVILMLLNRLFLALSLHVQ